MQDQQQLIQCLDLTPFLNGIQIIYSYETEDIRFKKAGLERSLIVPGHLWSEGEGNQIGLTILKARSPNFRQDFVDFQSITLESVPDALSYSIPFFNSGYRKYLN